LHALVIGINRFNDSKIRNLKYCRADAEELVALITDRRYLPYDQVQARILVDKDATLDKVRYELNALAKKAAYQDTVIVYFSAHGIQQDNGQAYWVLNDSIVDRNAYNGRRLRIIPGTALGQLEISQILNRIKARRLVVFVDSCYSAATVISYPRGRNYFTPVVRDPFAEFKGKGHIILTASEGTQQAVELPDKGHSAFTYYLIEGLKGAADSKKDNVVELWEIWRYLKKKVTDAAKLHNVEQNPTISSRHLTHAFPLTTYPLVPMSQAHNILFEMPKPIEWITIKDNLTKNINISTTEITNRQFLQFVKENPRWRKGRIPAAYHDGDYLRHWPSPESYPEGFDDHPVTYISWFAAKTFANWVGGRLPTESEWMVAAGSKPANSLRGSVFKKHLYPWGNKWNSGFCNHGEEGDRKPGRKKSETVPVKSFIKGAINWPAGPIYNLSGNVWEWCDDWVFVYKSVSEVKGSVELVDKRKKPTLNRLIKGGSYLSNRLGCMISSRIPADPRLCAKDGGFRVVRDKK